MDSGETPEWHLLQLPSGDYAVQYSGEDPDAHFPSKLNGLIPLDNRGLSGRARFGHNCDRLVYQTVNSVGSNSESWLDLHLGSSCGWTAQEPLANECVHSIKPRGSVKRTPTIWHSGPRKMISWYN